MTNAIETTGLCRSYRKLEAVRDLTLTVPVGSIFALLGTNGAGKTTTLKMLVNLLRPSGGRAEVLGVESTRLRAAHFERIGYVSENQQLPEWMTVDRLIAYCRPLYPTWDDDLCRRLLRRFALPLDRKLKHLSRGMKMQAALTVSVAYRPRLLILDEPFSGLDAMVRDDLIAGLLELVEQDSWTVLLSSHDIGEVERIADHVAFLDRGELRLCDSLENLAERFRQVVVTAAAEALPSLWPTPWLYPQQSGRALRFVDSAYRPGASEARVRELFPRGGEPVVSPLSLRDLFVVLARANRADSEIRWESRL